MRPLFRTLGCTLALALLCGGVQAQSLDQAKKLYNEGKYTEAKPVFEKLVKQAPSNASYNHWYGVCCYETGDMTGAEKYLSIAVKRKVQDAYRYLGEVYYTTYRFGESVGMYEEYIALQEKKKLPTEVAQARLDQAEKGLRMMDKVENVQVIDSMVVAKEAFLSAYTLSEESGTLSRFDEIFDANQAVETSVYRNQKGSKIYYALPTADNNYCLFTQSYLADKWGDEKQLPMSINSGKDDNYPFVLSDGVTVYFASKGNGSLGGYDLFVTRYNMATDNYLAPEQLGMPYNSPYNDYMMVIDEAKELGWFVSDRYQPQGSVCVYLFIPNDKKARLETDDTDQKRSRAALTSIRDSWVAGSNYNTLVELSHKAIPFGKQETKRDFEFVINDNTVYYTLNQLKSPEAKGIYTKVVGLNKQIRDLQARLDGLRADWNKGNNARRDQLKPTILQAEAELNALMDQPDELEKQARNAEINFLKKSR